MDDDRSRRSAGKGALCPQIPDFVVIDLIIV